MSVYGNLSKSQRKLLTALYSGISIERAVSIGTALLVDVKGRQTAENLKAKGYVDHDGRWRPRVWLTPAGVALMRSLDFRHSRSRA